MRSHPGPADQTTADPSPNGQPAAVRRKLPTPVRLLVAGLILAALLVWVGPATVLDRFAGIPIPAALAGLGGALLAQWVGSVRLRLTAAAQGFRVTTGEAWSINLSAVFYGLFLPGGSATGWAVRLVRLNRREAGLGAAVFALGADRVASTVTLAGIGVIADVLLGSPAGPAVPALLLAVTLATACLYLMLFGLLPPGVAAAVRGSRVGRWGLRFWTRPERPGHGKQLGVSVAAILLSLGMHALGSAVWLLLARAVGVEASLGVIIWARSAAMAAALLPVSVGGLGLREGASVYVLSFVGVAAADALALSLAVFAVTVLAIGSVGGVGELWRWSAPRRPVTRRQDRNTPDS